MRISDWSSDVCSSDLRSVATLALFETSTGIGVVWRGCLSFAGRSGLVTSMFLVAPLSTHFNMIKLAPDGTMAAVRFPDPAINRSDEHTSELQSLMRISYAVFCLKKSNTHISD